MAQVDSELNRSSHSADPTDGAARWLTPARYPNNLPLQLNRFIGRERAIDEIKRRLWSTRLLTLTGPGGWTWRPCSLHFTRRLPSCWRVWF